MAKQRKPTCVGFKLLIFTSVYFETIACEHLVGTVVKPEYLNDDKLGRVIDKLFIKELDIIFFIIALKAARKCGVSLSTSHLDSSCFGQIAVEYQEQY
ncbi:DUF4277 domain-containing protein [Okeanomitos corallinicola TIOX110]|uniref:DUF4277 domain-containing protein n=1 Tax=Okeanomitos corallinicola TIOX110 TaxID=3133117 RepID=A0ABZ2UTN6_9CYAN